MHFFEPQNVNAYVNENRLIHNRYQNINAGIGKTVTCAATRGIK